MSYQEDIEKIDKEYEELEEEFTEESIEIKKEDLSPLKNPKQERFVKEYLIDLNASKAVVRAGYSKSNARHQGSRFLSNANISQHIQYYLQERSKKMDIKAQDVVRELAGIGFSDMSHFIEMGDKSKAEALSRDDFDSDEDYQDEYNRLIMAFRVRSFEDMGNSIKAIEEINVTVKGGINIKLKGKIKALELIGKHIGMWNYEPESGERNRESNLDRIRSAIRTTRDRVRERERSAEAKKNSGDS